MNTDTVSKNATFITLISWVFILIGGFIALGTLMQSLMLTFLFSNEEFAAAMQLSSKDMPAQAAFMIDHIRSISWSAFAIAALLVSASLGMLRRKHWARLLFISMMWLFAVVTVTMAVVQLGYLANLSTGDQDLPEGFIKLLQATKLMSLLFGIGLGVLFGWLGWKLARPAIKAEFRLPAGPNADPNTD
jgi:hypothetical protein